MSEPHDSIFRIKQPTELVPRRVMTPTFCGNGLATVFLKRLPIVLPLPPRFPIEERRKPVGHIQAERLIAPDESHDASSGDSGFLLQGFVRDVRDIALGDCSPKQVGNRRD